MDLLAVQRTVKSLLKHHSSKALILQHSAFFIVQFSHSYMTTGKTMALTRQTFVGKVMSLLFNMLSRLVIPFLPRNKHLNFMAAVTICSDFGDKKKKSATVSTVSPAICHEVMGHYIITKKKKKRSLLFKPHNPWYFVKAATTQKSTVIFSVFAKYLHCKSTCFSSH